MQYRDIYLWLMKRFLGSLRQKILLSYFAGAAIILGFAMLSWDNLNNQQKIIVSGDSVTSLFDTTLEIRRFEKNYFLYRTDADYKELSAYIDQAAGLLESPDLTHFTSSDVISGLNDDLHEYDTLLSQDAPTTGREGNPGLENSIREKGKEIVTTTGEVSDRRNAVNQESLQTAKRNLIFGIGALLAAVLAGGIVFSRKAIVPLSLLEKHMIRITSGEFSLIPVKSRDREFVSLKAAFNKMLLELRERQEYLVESEKYAALGTLVFGVAHELNNPLGNISTSCQILKEEIGDGDIDYKKELLDQIEAETNRARDVVSSLLNFSRSKEKNTFGLKSAVEETVRLIRAEVPANVALEIAIPADLTVYAGRQKIQQVIINLVKNAIDAMAAGGRIRVLASRLDESHAEIVVLDNGAGMDQEQLDKIFDPFYTSKAGGYGLGLFIVHSIVTDYGGTISVDSFPGKGTTFTIVLPTKEP